MRNSFLRVVLAGVALSIPSSSAFAGSGWDYDLHTRCAASPWPNKTNYYTAATQCAGALPGAPHWQLGVQTEGTLGQSCTGDTAGQSFLIFDQDNPVNDPNSPARIHWVYNQSTQTWSVNMWVDQSSHPVTCPGSSSVWTWFSFQDQTSNLPKAHALEASNVIYYTHWETTPNDATRLFAGAQLNWGGKDRFVEVNLNHVNYGYPPAHPYGLLLSYRTGTSDFIILDGAAFGLHVQEGVQTQLYIPWWYLVQVASDNGWFSSPIPPGDVTTGTVHLGIEVKDRAIANLWHSNFRIADKPNP